MCADKVGGPYDAVIVGSGISGALIAKKLGLAKKKVLILEAGERLPANVNDYMNRFFNAVAKIPESPYPPELPSDPAKVKAGRPNVLELLPGIWDNPAKSYLVQNADKQSLPFASTYERVNGGTVRHWLGTSLRFVPADFEMNSRYGKFVDWPIKYRDLEPWYGEAEKEIGVSADAAEQTYLGITFSSDYPMPKIPESMVDKRVAAAMPGLKVPGVGLDDLQWKVSNTPAGRNSQPYQDRRVCAGNTNCIPICPIQAKYDPSVTLADALRTGNVDVVYNCVASKVLVGTDGRISGIQYIQYDKESQSPPRQVSGKIYILAGNAIETPRLLLMSEGANAPRGVGNGREPDQAVIGRYLMDHPLYLAWALAPKSVWGYRGPLSTSGIEVCRDGDFRKERGAFRIEIGNEGWNFPIGDPHTTTLDFVNAMNDSNQNGDKKALFGEDLAKHLNNILSRQFRLGFLVEQEPEFNNRVSLAVETDGLGLRRPAIAYNLSDYTKRGLAAAQVTATAIFKAMGIDKEATTDPSKDEPSAFFWQPTGKRIQYYGAGHIVGTHRMGSTKADSAVNDKQQSWHHNNLYLVGSGSFPTVATGNPTLTIAALCLRTADYIINSRQI